MIMMAFNGHVMQVWLPSATGAFSVTLANDAQSPWQAGTSAAADTVTMQDEARWCGHAEQADGAVTKPEPQPQALARACCLLPSPHCNAYLAVQGQLQSVQPQPDVPRHNLEQADGNFTARRVRSTTTSGTPSTGPGITVMVCRVWGRAGSVLWCCCTIRRLHYSQLPHHAPMEAASACGVVCN